MKNNKRIMYLRDDQYFPVGCLAIAVSKGRKQVSYQLSVLNPVDNFERSLARHIALGRLVEAPFCIRGFDGTQGKQEITEAVMKAICKSKTAPGRAKKAARNWLKYNTVPNCSCCS